MIKWEYNVLYRAIDSPKNLYESLDPLGIEGWELIGMIADEHNVIQYVFKRPINESS